MTAATRTAIYCRISRDRNDTTLGVKRQEKLCRALVADRGWSVALEPYVDNDVSATRRKKRPAYERMLDDLRAGVFQVIVALDSDRLLRRPLELEHLLELCEEHGVRVVYSSGGFDTATGEGVMEARIRAAVDAEEVAKLKKRVRRKAEELALAGKVGGGGDRPFGFEDDRITIRESEAVLIREALDRVLAGDSIRGIAADWTARGIPTIRGGDWYTSAIKRILTRPRIAGRREHRGIDVAKAEWDAIVDYDKWERARAILTDPARKKHGGQLGRRYLLTGGLVFCGECGAPLTARPKQDGRRCYVCATGPGCHGCGKIRQLAEPLEEYVRDAVLEALDSPEVARGLQATDSADGEEAALYEALKADEELLAAYEREAAERGLGPATYFEFRAKVEARMEENRQRIAELQGTSVLVSLPSGDLRDAWDAGSLDWRRSLVGAVVERVVVGSAVKGRNFFDPERVKFEWRA